MKSLTPRQILVCLGRGAVKTIEHDGIEHAGYLAFLGLLALFPFLVFMVSVIGFIGQGEAGAALITAALEALPEDVTAALRPRVVEIVSGPPQGLLTVSILGAVWTASSAVEGIRTVLNRAYQVKTPPAYLLRRSLSVAQLMLFTFIIISGMLLLIALPLVLHRIENWLGVHFLTPDSEAIGKMLQLGSVGVMFCAVCYIYYTIPNMKQRLMSVVPGALLVVIGWLGAATLLTLYLSYFDQVNLIYGSLGGLIAALLFFYICNIIFIWGAEFNHQIMEVVGMRVIQREEVPGSAATEE